MGSRSKYLFRSTCLIMPWTLRGGDRQVIAGSNCSVIAPSCAKFGTFDLPKDVDKEKVMNDVFVQIQTAEGLLVTQQVVGVSEEQLYQWL